VNGSVPPRVPWLVGALTLGLIVMAACGAPVPTSPASAPMPEPVPASTAPTATAQPTRAAELPAQLLDLTNWKLTLPTGRPGRTNEPEEIEQPQLATFSSEFFHLNDAKDGVVFTAEVGGVTTSGSSYPRSELREMDGPQKASWSNTTGTHTMRLRQAVTQLPSVKPHVVTAQIHDAEDDVIEVRLEARRLLVEYDDGDGEVTLDPAYQLSTPYDLEIAATGGRIQVSYNGQQKADIVRSGSGWYFKTGSYVQSNPSRGDAPDTIGQVVLYSLNVEHEN